MQRRHRQFAIFGIIQLLVIVAFASSYAGLSDDSAIQSAALSGGDIATVISIEREQPLVVEPLYNDPEVVSDEELAAVLNQLLPRFDRHELSPNHVEHALRTWGVNATFSDPAVMSGLELRDFLTDHGKFLQSWGNEPEPLLIDRPHGVSVRWDRKPGGSVHHDHWLASLTEAGVTLNEPVFAPGRHNATINDVLQQALRDFRLDEREMEWSAMAFGFWLPPTRSWTTADGRLISFDEIAHRLVRGDQRFGVCSGTHRVYSLMLLLRLDDQFDILSDDVSRETYAHLESVRDRIAAAQFPDGHWASNWSAGADSVTNPIDEVEYKKVIATGHHLEWLAIAPRELHPAREQILKAADWVIRSTLQRSQEDIRREYTFYSHIGTALALWRGTHPATFWRQWQTTLSPGTAEGP